MTIIFWYFSYNSLHLLQQIFLVISSVIEYQLLLISRRKRNQMTQSTSAYIHIPFCEHICYYCDFNKVFIEGQPVDEYIEALLKEVRLSLSKNPVENMETVYVEEGHLPLLMQCNWIDC